MRLCATGFLQMRCYNQQFSTTLLTFMCRIAKFVSLCRRLAAPMIAVSMGGSLIACGGYNSGTPTGLSKLKERVFVSVQALSFGVPSGQLNIINAGAEERRIPQDQVYPVPICVFPITGGCGPGVPGKLVLTPDKSKTLVLDASNRTVFTISNA